MSRQYNFYKKKKKKGQEDKQRSIKQYTEN